MFSRLSLRLSEMNNLTLIEICSTFSEEYKQYGCSCQPESDFYDECSYLISSVASFLGSVFLKLQIIQVWVMFVNGFMITKTSKLYDLIVLRYGLQFILIVNFVSGALDLLNIMLRTVPLYNHIIYFVTHIGCLGKVIQ